MTLPNFFILGAPKCGTTSIANWLARHPQVYFSPVKEPYFYNSDHERSGRITPQAYEALFDGANDSHRAVGEGTVWYLFSREAVGNIERVLGRIPRFIVCLRNPIDMANSLFHEMRFNGNETLPTLERAWDAQEERRRHRPTLPGIEPTQLQYGAVCSLGAQLQRLYGEVDRERVHLVLLEDLGADPATEFSKILDFLGLDPVAMDFNAANVRKARRSQLVQRLVKHAGRIKYAIGFNRSLGILKRVAAANAQAGKADVVPEALRGRLRAYFEDDIRLLSELTGRDLSGWR